VTNMRAQIHTQNVSPPLDAATRDILAKADYLDRAYLRTGRLDDAQIEMLRESANVLRRELRAKARAA
jgi:hypothetical protein